jgi:hypothetical protein
MRFPAQQLHFPPQTLNFPVQTLNFPVQTLNFPVNTLNFPNNTLNFPRNTFNFPSYNTNFGAYNPGYGTYGIYSPSVSRRQVQSSTASMMSTSAGLGAMIATVPGQHHAMHHTNRTAIHHNTSNRNGIRSVGGVTNLGSTGTLPLSQRRFNSFVHDLDTLTPGQSVVDFHRNTIQLDLFGLVEGGNRPSVAAVKQLAGDLAESMTRRTGQPINTAVLAGDLKTVMNSLNLPQARINTAIQDAEVALNQGNFQPADVRMIVADLRNIASGTAATSQSNQVR